jgi:hypothetical protein
MYVGINSIDPLFQIKYCNSAIVKNLEKLKQYKNIDVSIETIITNEEGINIENLSKLYSFVLENNYKWVVYTDFAYCKNYNDNAKLSKLFSLVSSDIFDKNIYINNVCTVYKNDVYASNIPHYSTYISSLNDESFYHKLTNYKKTE